MFNIMSVDVLPRNANACIVQVGEYRLYFKRPSDAYAWRVVGVLHPNGQYSLGW